MPDKKRMCWDISVPAENIKVYHYNQYYIYIYIYIAKPQQTNTTFNKKRQWQDFKYKMKARDLHIYFSWLFRLITAIIKDEN